MILPTVQALANTEPVSMFLLSVLVKRILTEGLLYSDHVRIHLCNPYIRVSTDPLTRVRGYSHNFWDHFGVEHTHIQG